MKVRCITTNCAHLDPNEVPEVTQAIRYRGGEYGWGLTLGLEYLVCGLITGLDGNCIYYLSDEENVRVPTLLPYPFFEILDTRLPRSWCVRIKTDNDYDLLHYIAGFPEFCNDPKFYCDLMEREQPALSIYAKRKAEMEAEFALRDQLEGKR